MKNFSPIQFSRLIFFCVLSGILCGVAVWILSFSLHLVTSTREAHEYIIWFLPLAGFIIGTIYYHFGQSVAGGTDLIIEEILEPKIKLPIRKAPFIFLSTILTHLFGGPTGREGTAVQMGVAFTDRLQDFFTINREERKILMIAAAGASFGAMLGAPWAGSLFGMEVITIGRFKLHYWLECLVTSFVAYFTMVSLHYHDFELLHFQIPDPNLITIFYSILSGIIFGITSQIFVKSKNFVHRCLSRFFTYPPFATFIGGVVVIILFYIEGTNKFKGLGLSEIKQAFMVPEILKTPFLKLVYSSITVGSGFKGGEFIPMVFIGSTLGSALSSVFPISFQLLAGMGFVAVFAGAANAPLTLSIVAIEIFGFKMAPYSFLACYSAYYFSGHSGIFHAQKVYLKKHQRLLMILRWAGDLPRKFFKNE